MSDLLGLYGLVRHFVEARVPRDPRIADVIYNFELACKAVDIVLAVKRRRTPAREGGRLLQATLEQHLQNHVKLNGNDKVKPKNHWAFDIAECMQQGEPLLDLFATERLHLRAKQVSQYACKLQYYDDMVMRGICNVHFNHLTNHGVFTTAMSGATARMPGAAQIIVAQQCTYFGEQFEAGDFVFRGTPLGWCVICIR